MYKQRNIREAAIQFLYLADLEGSSDASEMEESFWQLILEKDLNKINSAVVKSVLHVAQGRESRVTKLREHALTSFAKIKADSKAESLGLILQKIIAQESKLDLAVADLKAKTLSKFSHQSTVPIGEDILNISSSLTRLRTEFFNLLEDFPSHQHHLEPCSAAMKRLERISERLDAITNPESTIGDFAHIRNSTSAIDDLQQRTQSLVRGVLSHKTELDAALTNVIANYSPDRVMPIDRAILRLACYEILHCSDIPKAVSINEAIEIAKRFSGSESSKFINGVLDAL